MPIHSSFKDLLRQDISNIRQHVSPPNRLGLKERHTIFFPMDNQASPAKRKSQGVQSIVDLPETVEPSKLRLLTTSPKGKGDRVSDTTDKDLVVRRDVLKKSLDRLPSSWKKCLRLGILCGMTLSKFPRQAFAVKIEGCPVDYYLNFTNSDSSVDVLVNRLQAQFDRVFPVLMKRLAQKPCDAAFSEIPVNFTSLPGNDAAYTWWVHNPEDTTGNCIPTLVLRMDYDNKKIDSVDPNLHEGLFTHELVHVAQRYPFQPNISQEYHKEEVAQEEGTAEKLRREYREYGLENDQPISEDVNPQSNWTDGYGVTAGWMSDLEQHGRPTIVDDLNRLRQNCSYTYDRFSQLIGQDVNSNWEGYKSTKLAEQQEPNSTSVPTVTQIVPGPTETVSQSINSTNHASMKSVEIGVPSAIGGALLLLGGIYLGIKKYKKRAQNRQPNINLDTNTEENV